MAHKSPLIVLSLAAAVGCANCDPSAPQAGGGAAAHSAEAGSSAEGPVLTPPPPGVQVAAYAPASDSNDGRVFFAGDRRRAGLNGGGGVRGSLAGRCLDLSDGRGRRAGPQRADAGAARRG